MWFDSAVVLYGCSVMHGAGLRTPERPAVCLAAAVNRAVVDLSYPGVGNQYIRDIQQEFHDTYCRPWREIVCWSEPVRFTDYHSRRNHGHWTLGSWPPGTAGVDDSEYWDQQTLEARQQFLARSPGAIEFTWNTRIKQLCPEIQLWGPDQWLDRTTESHPGPKSVRALAQHLAQIINSH
jgi:hypothetical protein